MYMCTRTLYIQVRWCTHMVGYKKSGCMSLQCHRLGDWSGCRLAECLDQERVTSRAKRGPREVKNGMAQTEIVATLHKEIATHKHNTLAKMHVVVENRDQDT